MLPLVMRIADELTAWLADVPPVGAEIVPDRDEVARRTGERDSFWRERDQLSFLTTADIRCMTGTGGHPAPGPPDRQPTTPNRSPMTDHR